MLGDFACKYILFSSADFFTETIRVSNSLDPDKARHSVGPDLGPNCLQRLSSGDTSLQRVKNEAFTKPFMP